jgi:hypothetical protein
MIFPVLRPCGGQNREDQSTRHQEKEKEPFHKCPPLVRLKHGALAANKLDELAARGDVAGYS